MDDTTHTSDTETKTTHYNLIKPGYEDYYNIDKFNENADIIDTTLYGKEDASNKVETIDETSTNEQYPSAKAVYDLFSNGGGGGGSSFPIGNVTNLKVKVNDGKLTLIWNDPGDFVVEGVTLSTWKGTKVVYKTGSYPIGPDDGTLAVNSQVLNQYSITGFEITGLTNDETYYIQLFPYSTDGFVNTNEDNRTIGTPAAHYIYGIKRSLTTNSPEWERIDDAIGLVANAQIGTEPVQNDFDSRYPWSDIYTYSWNKNNNTEIRYDAEGFNYTDDYIFTKIPEFWYKREQDSNYEYIQIANYDVEGFTKSEEFSVGRYTISSSTSAPTSKSGIRPLINNVRNDFRTAAKTLPGCCLWDWHYFILQILYLVEYADYDSQAKLGNGVSSSSALINNGSCDALGMKSGRPEGENGKTGVIYRGIENIFGNIWQWVDGINFVSDKAYICTNPDSYADNTTSGDYVGLSYTNASSGGWVSELGHDPNHPLFAFPTAVNGSATTYMCDNCVHSSPNSRGAAVGGLWGGTSSDGLFYWFLAGSGLDRLDVGSRLLRYE